MSVHLYAACWNEIDMLDFFFRHYDGWVDRYIIFDDGSTDGSLDRLRRHPRVSLHRLERTHADSLILSLLDLYNHGWKRSRGEADWVLVVNVDEHVWHPDMPALLARYRHEGVTVVPTLGYQMVARRDPAPGIALTQQCRVGAPWVNMSKLALFDPDRIEEIGYRPGRHMAAPVGTVRYPARDDVLTLHYKCVGTARLHERHRSQRRRLLPSDVAHGWGHRYALADENTERWINDIEAAAVDPFAPGHDPHMHHPAPRWWRRR